MERLGQYLRAERSKRGMSLEEVSARTRIRLQTLEALERDDYPLLPAEVTVKGFLRAYARCLGLDEREVSTRYQEFAAEYFKIAQEDDPVARAARSGRQHAWQHKLTGLGLTAAALMVVISGVMALSPRSQSDQHPTDIAAPMELPPPPVSEPVPVPGAGEPIVGEPVPESVPSTPPAGPPSTAPAPATAPPREASKPQQLAVTANETSWVQVTIDNGETKEVLLQPGQRVGWSGEREFRLTVGNAGGVTVEFNGEPIPSLGPSGRVRTVVLPRLALNADNQSARAQSAPAPRAAIAPAPTTATSAPQAPSRSSPSDRVPPALTSPADSTTVPPHPLQ
ncbi:MAG: RodZ domain-containing protein [Nitrospirota bacterium]